MFFLIGNRDSGLIA